MIHAWKVIPNKHGEQAANRRAALRDQESGEPPLCFACGAGYADRVGGSCQGCVDDYVTCETCRREYSVNAESRQCMACLTELAIRVYMLAAVASLLV